MERNYYVKSARGTAGPFDAKAIERMIASGIISPDTELSNDRATWRSANSFGFAFMPEIKEWRLSVDGQLGYESYSVEDILALIDDGSAPLDAIAWRKGETPRALSKIPEFSAAIRRRLAANRPRPSASSNSAEPLEWTIETNRIYGPYSSRQLVARLRSGCVSEKAVVRRNRRERYSVSEALALVEAPPVVVAPSVPAENAPPIPTDDEPEQSKDWLLETNRKMKIFSFWAAFFSWISAIVFVFGIAFAVYAFFGEYESDFNYFMAACEQIFGAALVLIFFFSFVMATTSAFFGAFFLHAFWSSIPSRGARTTPMAAGALLFVPIVNLYWLFVAFRGGAIDVDLALGREADLRAESAIDDYADVRLVTSTCALAVGLSFLAFPWQFVIFGLRIAPRNLYRAAKRLNEIKASRA